jgi:hypothetical protein
VNALAASSYWEQLRRPPDGLGVGAARRTVADAIIAILERLE